MRSGKRSQDPSTGKNLLFKFFIKRYQLVLGCAELQGSRVTQKGGYMCTNKSIPSRKGLGHIANSLKEINSPSHDQCAK